MRSSKALPEEIEMVESTFSDLILGELFYYVYATFSEEPQKAISRNVTH